MTKKGIVTSIIAIAIIGTMLALFKQREGTNTGPIENAETTQTVEKIQASELHSDILRFIVDNKEANFRISKEEAEKELANRTGNDVEIDKMPADVKKLPFDIVQAIAKSHVSVAGIQPRNATNEIVNRYLALDLSDSDDVNTTILLGALQHRGEQEAIDAWAKNEDAEAIEAFMKEEADRDPSSVANLAYGIKHLEDNHDIAVEYMNRYAEHIKGDAFDNQDEEKSYNELIAEIKKLN